MARSKDNKFYMCFSLQELRAENAELRNKLLMEETISRKKSMEIESIARQNKGNEWYIVAMKK